MKRYTKIGFGITAAWGLLCARLFLWRFEDTRVMTLNEWGDFLAGMAAPIALFWVVIGYFQQGEELSLNTKALELQQKETATLARNMDREAKVSEELMFRQTMASQPDIVTAGGGSCNAPYDDYDYRVTLNNRGETATEIKLHYEGLHGLGFRPLDRWNRDDSAELYVRLVRDNDNDPEFPIRFRFEYTDRLQKRRTREGELWENYRITFKKLDLTQAGA